MRLAVSSESPADEAVRILTLQTEIACARRAALRLVENLDFLEKCFPGFGWLARDVRGW